MRKVALAVPLLAFAGGTIAADPGSRRPPAEGQIIELTDDRKVMMKSNAIWKTLTEHGTLKPGH